MYRLSLLVVLMTSLSTCKGQVHNRDVESIALNYVFNELILKKNLLEYEYAFFDERPSELKGLLDSNMNFYSSGNTCELSTIGRFAEDDFMSTEEVIEINGLNEDRKVKAELNQKIILYELPKGIHILSFREFEENIVSNGFFITVLHHIEFNGISVVEINITSTRDLPNLAEHTFYVRMGKENQVLDYIYTNGYSTDVLQDCQND